MSAAAGGPDEREHLRPARRVQCAATSKRYLDKNLPEAIHGEHDDRTKERLRGALSQQYPGAPGEKQRRYK